MSQSDALRLGREAFGRRQWKAAHAYLLAADAASPLAAPDLEQLAAAAYLIGEDAFGVHIWTRLHHELTERGRIDEAAHWACWLSLCLFLGGEPAQASGWFARAQRLLTDRKGPSPAQGYVHVISGLQTLVSGDAGHAVANFAQTVDIAMRFEDADLLALGLLGHGQALILSRDIAAGMARLDEAMIGVTAERVTPVLCGIVYCGVILSCQSIFDLRRAQEWTSRLDAWCTAQPDLQPYRGQCLVHRSEILQARGDWTGALAEIGKARRHLARQSAAVIGRACYQQGELHRLRGELKQADELYREADRCGCEPQPGAALCRLARGEVASAAAAMCGLIDSLEASRGPGFGVSRPKLLGPLIEILLANDDIDAAHRYAEELAALAQEFNAPYLLATSAQASGAVAFAQGDAHAAMRALREAWTLWQQLEMPYESARTRVLLARACRQLGDAETAQRHIDAAHAVFQRLNAVPDLDELDRLTIAAAGPLSALTQREREVLALVANGDSNRNIAAALAISEHTVARHLGNIFNKLGVNSRTAASAFAHMHKLV